LKFWHDEQFFQKKKNEKNFKIKKIRDPKIRGKIFFKKFDAKKFLNLKY